MEAGLAPRAFRMPNSCVRSRTVISMMLLTPTMPLSRVKIPITQMAVCRISGGRLLLQVLCKAVPYPDGSFVGR